MSRRRTTRLAWAVLTLVLCMAVLFGWVMAGLHVHDPGMPVSAEEATSFASIRIPDQAANIRIAGYHQWIESQQFVRFEAPTAICLQTAADVLPGMNLEPAESYELASATRFIRPGIFRDLSWFDLHKAKNVVAAGGGPSVPRIWIDQDHGVFYYHKTD